VESLAMKKRPLEESEEEEDPSEEWMEEPASPSRVRDPASKSNATSKRLRKIDPTDEAAKPGPSRPGGWTKYFGRNRKPCRRSEFSS